MKQENQDENEYLFDNLIEYQAFIKNNKRTMLHTKSTVGWLKSRYPQKTKKHYLLFPEELIEDIKIRKIFKIFDKDGSQALDLEEMVNMFRKYNIEIDREELQQIYDIVDKTKDNALNYLEFKECAISQDANSIFSKMIKKVRNQEINTKSREQQNIYLPQRFAEMVTYLSYRINRDDLEQYLNQRNHRIIERYEKFLQLMNLNGLDSAGAAAHENQLKDIKKLDKASDLEQKIFARGNSSNSDNELNEGSQTVRNQKKEELLRRQQKSQIGYGMTNSNSNMRQSIQIPSPSISSKNQNQSQVDHAHQNNQFLSVNDPQVRCHSNHSNLSASQINSQRNSLMFRANALKEMEEEPILAKFTSFEANNLVKKAQIKGTNDAQKLFSQISEHYNSSENSAKPLFLSQNQQKLREKQTKTPLKSDVKDRNENSSNNKLQHQGTEQSELTKRETQTNIGKTNYNSFQNLHKSDSTDSLYGKREKFSNNELRTTSRRTLGSPYNQYEQQQIMSDTSKFNNTSYTLGRRMKAHKMQLNELGIDKSSFKNISSIMNRTLEQLEKARAQKNIFFNIVPSFERVTQHNDKKVKQLSRKLISSNSDANIVDPKLMKSLYKHNQIQEYQEREKQLVNEIKQDIMDKFLLKNKLTNNLVDELSVNTNIPQSSFNRNQIIEQSFHGQLKQRENDILSKYSVPDKSSPQKRNLLSQTNRQNMPDSELRFRIKNVQNPKNMMINNSNI